MDPSEKIGMILNQLKNDIQSLENNPPPTPPVSAEHVTRIGELMSSLKVTVGEMEDIYSNYSSR